MRMGLSHRQTVLAIYGISLIFSFVSLLSLVSPRWGIWLLILGLLFAVELFVETIGLLGEKYKPLLHFLQHTINKMERADPEVKVRRLNKRIQIKRFTLKQRKSFYCSWKFKLVTGISLNLWSIFLKSTFPDNKLIRSSST